MTLWAVAHKIPLSMGLPRQEYWSGLQSPSSEGLPHPEIQPMSLLSSALANRFVFFFLTTVATWGAHKLYKDFQLYRAWYLIDNLVHFIPRKLCSSVSASHLLLSESTVRREGLPSFGFSPLPDPYPATSHTTVATLCLAFKKVKVTSWCLTLCNPKVLSPPGPSVHEILQARILEWVAIPFF